jgi:hypothetical protein
MSRRDPHRQPIPAETASVTDPAAFPATEDCFRYDGTLGCEAIVYADAVAADAYRYRFLRNYRGDLDDLRQSARMGVVVAAATAPVYEGGRALPWSKLEAAVDAAIDAEMPRPRPGDPVGYPELPRLVDENGEGDPNKDISVYDREPWEVDDLSAEAIRRFRNTVERHAGADGLHLLLRVHAIGETVEEIAKSRCNRVTKVTAEQVRRELAEATAAVATRVPPETVERVLRCRREGSRGW